jgi:fermentation-respiration switch protein FrsA (DUF1100 family)
MRAGLPFLGIAIVGFAAIVLAFWVGQRSLMYLPSGHVDTPADSGLARAELVRLHTDDGLDLGAWFAPPAATKTRGTIIVFNGNAGNRSYRGTLGARLAQAGFAVLLFDYRGYGGNAGSPSEDGLIQDARAARRYLTTRPDVDPRRMIYFGESLGAGVAVALALEQPPAALILRSPFSSAVDVGRFHYPWLPVGWILKDRFSSIERMPRLTTPTLFIAGERDRIVPSSQTRALFEVARGRKDLFVLSDADHNDEALAEGPQVIARIAAFVDDVLDSNDAYAHEGVKKADPGAP